MIYWVKKEVESPSLDIQLSAGQGSEQPQVTLMLDLPSKLALL